ncbi:hypothetical protein [Longimicrobium sp.]|jgi:hypothetical protein|uniref:hypothetical protein n=1 Tax=Longimicrobium sp. TaxID=2029185 RepID=UPI002ED79EF2
MNTHSLGSDTSHEPANASHAAEAHAGPANPVRLRIYSQIIRKTESDQVRPALMLPLPSTTVILRFGGGGVVTTRTDGNGWVFLPAETAGERVVMDPLVEPFLEFDAPECVLAPTGENVLKQRLTVQDK